MPHVIVSITGLKEALTELRNLAAGIKNRSNINRLVGESVLDYFTNDVYESEGKVFGHGWPELSMPYAFYKTRKWGPQQTLVASGQMRASNVLYTTGEMISIKNVATSKSGRYYAFDHQMGGGRLPQRILMDLDEDKKRAIGAMILSELDKQKGKGL